MVDRSRAGGMVGGIRSAVTRLPSPQRLAKRGFSLFLTPLVKGFLLLERARESGAFSWVPTASAQRRSSVAAAAEPSGAT